MPVRVQVLGHGMVEFPDGMSEADMHAALSKLSAPPPATTPEPSGGILQTAKDVGTGIVKGAAHTAEDLGSLVQMIPGAGRVTNAVGNAAGGAAGKLLYGTATPPVSNDAAMQSAREQTAYTNNAQRAGGALETVAEMAVPITKGAAVAAEAIPTTAKAATKFQSVMAAARNVPVDVEAPGQVALRIQQLADRGASMPMVVRKFLTRITDPEKAEMTYEEARDFASNISRLSANEYGRLSPVVGREVANLRAVMNRAVGQAAAQAGKGAEYGAAMREYAQAMKLRGVYDSVIEGAKRGLPYATAAGAGTWLTMKLKGLAAGD